MSANDTAILPDEPIEPDYRLLDVDPLELVRDVIFSPGDVTLLSQVMRVREEYERVTRGLEMPWELAIECLGQIRYRRGLDRPTPRCPCSDVIPIPARLMPVACWLVEHGYGCNEWLRAIRHIERTGTARLNPFLDGEDVSYIEELMR